jgi:hypothetical protein
VPISQVGDATVRDIPRELEAGSVWLYVLRRVLLLRSMAQIVRVAAQIFSMQIGGGCTRESDNDQGQSRRHGST